MAAQANTMTVDIGPPRLVNDGRMDFNGPGNITLLPGQTFDVHVTFANQEFAYTKHWLGNEVEPGTPLHGLGWLAIGWSVGFSNNDLAGSITEHQGLLAQDGSEFLVADGGGGGGGWDIIPPAKDNSGLPRVYGLDFSFTSNLYEPITITNTTFFLEYNFLVGDQKQVPDTGYSVILLAIPLLSMLLCRK
jgi:hypothetical protein